MQTLPSTEKLDTEKLNCVNLHIVDLLYKLHVQQERALELHVLQVHVHVHIHNIELSLNAQFLRWLFYFSYWKFSSIFNVSTQGRKPVNKWEA